MLAPKLTISSYSPRFSFKSDVGARVYRFRRFHSEDRTDAYANFQARTEITRDLRVDASAYAARLHEDRSESTSPSNAASPVPYTDLRGQLSVTKDFNRLSVMVGTTARNLTYENVNSFTGDVLDQSSRNGTILTAFVKPSYEINRDYRLYLLARANTRNYEGTGALEHDSKGYDLRGGLQFTLTPLIFGSVEAGYLQQKFDNPLIPTVTGPVIGSKVKWLVTPLTTVSFLADRHVSETAAPGQEARLDTAFGATIDHELMRNVIRFRRRHAHQPGLPGNAAQGRSAEVLQRRRLLRQPLRARRAALRLHRSAVEHPDKQLQRARDEGQCYNAILTPPARVTTSRCRPMSGRCSPATMSSCCPPRFACCAGT